MSKSKVDLPRQLQRQQEEIEQYDRDIAAAAATPASQDAPADPPASQDGQEPPAPAPAPVTPPPPSDDQWKQRFLTLKGKYDAEVPRLHSELRELRTKLDELVARRVETPTEPVKPKTKRVTEKDTETFGADLMDVIKRQAEEIAAEAVAGMSEKLSKLEAENEQLKQNLTGVTTSQAQTSQEVYFGKLAAAVPDWETINVDPKFLEWLGEIDEISGMPRQEHLTNAFNALNVDRTAKLFNAYKKTLPQAPAPKQPAQKQTEVQRQVAPGKSKTPPGPVTSDANSKIWSAAEIDKFYRDYATGQYRSNPQEAARIEAEIDAAVSTGRVRA